MNPHHDGSALYVTNPQPALGETVTVLLRAPGSSGPVHVRSTVDGEPHFAAAVVDRVAPDGETWWRADLTVRNPVTRYRWLVGDRWLGSAGVVDHDVPDAYDFRLLAYDPPPAWAREASIRKILSGCESSISRPMTSY